MQFAESSQDNYFFSQPHQPFFVLAFINAILTMVIFLLSYKGVLHIAIADNYFHGYSLTFLLFTPAFFGFLFTTFPRFASTPILEKKVYMRVFSLFYLGSVLFCHRYHCKSYIFSTRNVSHLCRTGLWCIHTKQHIYHHNHARQT